MVRVGRYNYEKSTRAGKKLMVKVGGKTIHFGSTASGHYKDRTGIWSSKDHGDKKRRASFRARMGGVKKKDGSKAAADPGSAAWHALRVLWT
jgi:hypothetical protein